MKCLERYFFGSLGCLLLLLGLTTPVMALNTMIDYTSFPPIISEPTKPNVLIMISNDHTGFYHGYNGLDDYDNTLNYWGYFDPLKEYEYKSGKFSPKGWTKVIDPLTGATDHYTTNSNYWSGNFLNWLTMTHADFLRKALTGGRRGNDIPSGTTLVRGDVPNNHGWTKTYNGSDLGKLVPSAYDNITNKFVNVGTTLDITDNNNKSVPNKPLEVEVATCEPSMPETGCTTYQTGSKPEGLIQRYHDKMLFGLMSYSHDKFDRGGILRTPIKDITAEFSQVNGSTNSSSDSLIRYIEQYTDKDYDPLAEMLYDGIRYLRGNNAAQAGFCPSGNTDDGFFHYGCTSQKLWVDPVKAWCQKNNIIIINDEYPSRDGESIPNSAFATYTDTPIDDFPVDLDPNHRVNANQPYNPDVTAITKMIGDLERITGRRKLVGKIIGDQDGVCNLKTITNLGEARGICRSEPGADGTFYLAALAYDAFTSDMRPDLKDAQHIRTYGIAFRATGGTYYVPPPPLNQMWLAGKYGNFDDMNGNNIPDLPEEWMKNSATCNIRDPNDDDCLPKGFFYAEGGDKIEKAVVEVFESILRRSASGTAVSVLATSGQGEGNLVQAYYRPAISTTNADGELVDIKWTGYLQSLWVDKYGYIREDSNHNRKLDEKIDSVIKYFLDTDGTTRVRRYPVTADAPFPDLLNDSFDVIEMGGVEVVWEGGKSLVDTLSSDREITTFIDKNSNDVIDSGELVKLTKANETVIRPYLALQDSTANAYLGLTETVRANNLISFIRGDDPGLEPASFIDIDNLKVRDRMIGGKTWRLGDIVNSTPVSIAAPPDRFDLIYTDKSYIPYYTKYKNRETMVYVGANDGMLHAFSSWQYDPALEQFNKPDAAGLTETIGSEVWAYVPQSLLPHLKWLARRDYTHVAYMDLQPRIFDARIFANDTTHPNGWGTVMIVGMNTGGGYTTVDFDGDGVLEQQFKPSFMAFDITDPRNPVLLWERSYDGLGFTRTIPTVIRIGDEAAVGDWYLIFGNGPDSGETSGAPNYRGETTSDAHIYIVDMKTGAPKSRGATDWWEDTTLDPRAFFNTPIAYDRGLNYSVDVAYMGTTYDSGSTFNGSDWRGSVYRILTLDPLDSTKKTYLTNPAEWTLSKVFSSPRPITAPGSLSVDNNDNVWAYFGTGRYISKGIDSDETSTEQEYLLGFKDPLFNPNYTLAADLNKIVTSADLVDSTPFKVLSTGQVLKNNQTTFLVDGTTVGPWRFSNLEDYVGTKDGWIRSLPIGATAERSLNKPAVVGGLSLFTTFSPKGDVCDYGGSSTLWAFYYKTGTAYYRPIFKGRNSNSETVEIDGETINVIDEHLSLGSGTTSSVGIHIGQQNDKVGADRYSENADGSFSKDPEGTFVFVDDGKDRYKQNADGTYSKSATGVWVLNGGTYDFEPPFEEVGEDTLYGDMATGFVQQGTGTVIDFEFETALKIRSGMKSWRERE